MWSSGERWLKIAEEKLLTFSQATAADCDDGGN
jgi:hypothetical protein